MSINLRAFLYLIRACEGTAGEDGYRKLFGGQLFDSFADHPRRVITASLGGSEIKSSAAGAYQFLSRTWDECAKALNLPDFSPESQDQAAIFLIKRRGALEDVEAGRIEDALKKCNKEWASLPGSPYGQPTKSLAECLAIYRRAGGEFISPQNIPAEAISSPVEPISQPSPPPDTNKMPAPFVLAGFELLTQLLPTLIRWKAKGPQGEENAKMAEKVMPIVQQVVGAVNAQDAAEKISADPNLLQVADKAVSDRWFDLVEVGGGIPAARSADVAVSTSAGPWWQFLRSPSFWALLLLIPLVYLIVLSIIGVLGPVQWSEDVRSAIAGNIVGIIVGGAVGYYWGQSTSRNRVA